ncbi:MAG: hypothetical protein WA691_08655 [Thermoplasmata archaeon]
MGLEDLILPVAASVAGAGIAGGLLWGVYTRWHVPVPPNKALVLFGGRSIPSREEPLAGASAVQIRRPRVIVGGSAFVAPWNRGAGYLSLGPVDADVTVRSMHAVDGGRASGWEAQFHVQARIPAQSATLLSAAENLLGKNEEEVRLVIRRAVEGAVPAVLARLRPTEGEPDWERLAAEVESSVAPDLIATGLAIRTLSVTGLHRVSPAEAGPAPTPSSPPRSTTQIVSRNVPGSDVELRMARVERGLGIMGAEIVRISRETREAPESYSSFSVFDSALGDDRPLGVLAPDSEEDPSHDSMGDDRSSRSRRPSDEGAVGEGLSDRRPLLDSEP